jgi:Tfp pilus assembly protein PilO
LIKGIKSKSKIIDKIAPLLLALAIIFTYSRLFIIPTFRALGDLSPKVATLKQNIKLAQSSIKSIGILKNQLSDLKQRIGNYENRLPQKKEIPTILQHLSQMAIESGVKITSIEPARELIPSASKDYTEVPITLTAKCGYHQLATFISKLESSRQFMKVSNIKITHNANDIYHHHVDLKISTFIIAEGGT